jgi:hypothetical protein
MYFLLNSDLPTILASEETAIIIIIKHITHKQVLFFHCGFEIKHKAKEQT